MKSFKMKISIITLERINEIRYLDKSEKDRQSTVQFENYVQSVLHFISTSAVRTIRVAAFVATNTL